MNITKINLTISEGLLSLGRWVVKFQLFCNAEKFTLKDAMLFDGRNLTTNLPNSRNHPLQMRLHSLQHSSQTTQQRRSQQKQNYRSGLLGNPRENEPRSLPIPATQNHRADFFCSEDCLTKYQLF